MALQTTKREVCTTKKIPTIGEVLTIKTCGDKQSKCEFSDCSGSFRLYILE